MAELTSFDQAGAVAGVDTHNGFLLETIEGNGARRWVQQTSSNSSRREFIDVDAGIVTAKQFDLAATPAGNIAMHVSAGGTASTGHGITVTGTTVSWAGQDLDGRVSAGMRFIVDYEV